MALRNGNYREFHLDNGLLVALQETPTRTVSGNLRVWHGAVHENPGEEGIAHFLEHTLMTGGSKKYDPNMAESIRRTFGYSNAFTSLDRTEFPVDMIAEDTSLYLEYVSDAAFNPAFDSVRVEQERERVLRETADAKSKPSFKDKRTNTEAFFGKNSPHSYLILGKEEIVTSGSIDSLRRFHGRGYHPNNMELILAGGLPQNVEELIRQNFESFKSGSGKKFQFPRNPSLTSAITLHTSAPDQYNVDNPSQSSAEIAMALVAPTAADEDTFVIRLLVSVLGGGGHGRLFDRVSNMEGLAYSIGAQYDAENNRGAIYIGGNVDARRAFKAVDVIFEEMTKLRTVLVSQDILENLKRNAWYNVAKSFETNEGRIYAIEKKLDCGKTPEFILEQINAVTPKRILEAAIKYLPSSRADGKYVLLLRDPLKK